MAGFLHTVEHLGPGANVELDVQLTHDGVPVVIHDATVDRTAADGATGSVHDMTLKELSAVRIGTAGNSWGLAAAASGERCQIPTLHEVLTNLRGRCHIPLELKPLQAGLVPAAAKVLAETGWLDRPSSPYVVGCGQGVTVFCQHLHQLQDVGQLAPNACRMLAVPQIDAAAVSTAQEHALEGLSTSATHPDLAEQVGLAKRAGLACRSAAIGPPTPDEGFANLRRAVEAGADGTTIDWPLEAARLLVCAQWGRR
eukprot:SAG22_NODE_1832_length_3477_cov_3.782416_1_plen_255_part_00